MHQKQYGYEVSVHEFRLVKIVVGIIVEIAIKKEMQIIQISEKNPKSGQTQVLGSFRAGYSHATYQNDKNIPYDHILMGMCNK